MLPTSYNVVSPSPNRELTGFKASLVLKVRNPELDLHFRRCQTLAEGSCTSSSEKRKLHCSSHNFVRLSPQINKKTFC